MIESRPILGLLVESCAGIGAAQLSPSTRVLFNQAPPAVMRMICEILRWCRRHRHPHPHIHVWLQINHNVAVLLNPHRETFVMSQLHVDQTVTLSLIAVDSAGTQVPFKPDAPPVWTNSDESVATSAVSPDGLTDTLTPTDAVGGVTTVNVSVLIGGVPFSATVDETVVAGAIAGIKIVETFAPKP